MKKIYLIAAVLAIACGVLVYTYFSGLEARVVEAEKEHAVPAVEMTNVVTAAVDIPPLTEITEEMISIERWPAEYIGEDVATSVDDVAGLQADGTIVKGQMIMKTGVGTLDEVVPSLSARVPEGMQAMTIGVDVSSGVGGYVENGDCINILGFIPGNEDEGIPDKTVIGIDGAEVLQVGNKGFTGEDGAIYTSLTLALSEAQTVKVFELMNTANIYFTLNPFIQEGEAQ